jgi:hypothetical protein
MAHAAFWMGSLLAASLATADDPAPRPPDPGQARERTCFQTHARWDPRLQVRSDVAVCYGIDASLPERMAQWREQGYITHLMTGVAWGSYQDYLNGEFDGVRHWDEGQLDRRGNGINHNPTVPYMCPTESFGKYLCVGVQKAIDAGAEAIHLEEPEFWVRGGYSEAFKREWRAYYGEDWIAPHTSPDAQYRASLLKYHLYQRALKIVFDYVKAENARTGKRVRCYVPTHSLINYAHWGIVSPESSLVEVGADGFIAQVWTGTARTPNVYEGVKKERTFETAFLEYGSMMNVVRASGGTVWFLNDPIEDNPDHSWEDYRTNWEKTLTASLLWPRVWRYEVMPWPERIYRGSYPKVDVKQRRRGEPVEKEPLPTAYGTEMMTVITALNDMEQEDVSWDCGTRGLGVVVSDTMMFHRGDPSPSDRNLGSFYGLALPLVKRGMPAEPVQLENATIAGALDPYRLLLMTYEGMKPMKPEVHDALAAWVKDGGALVFLGDDSDPYNAVKSWWNDSAREKTYKAPREHLFEALGLAADAAAGPHKVGKGLVLYSTASPAALTYREDGAETVRGLVKEACAGIGLAYSEANRLVLRRGPYVVAAGLDESVPGAAAPVVAGRFIDLFDARLPVLSDVTLAPGSYRLLMDLDRVPRDRASVIASACKALGATTDADGSFRFHAEGPEGVEAAARIALPAEPREVTVDGEALAADARIWDASSKTLFVRFPNSASGRVVVVK